MCVSVCMMNKGKKSIIVRLEVLSRVLSIFQEYLSTVIYEHHPKCILVRPIYHLDLYLGCSPLRPEVLVCTPNSFGSGFLVGLLLCVFFGPESDSWRIEPYNVSWKKTLYT